MDKPRTLEAALDVVYEQTYGPLAQEARDEDARHLHALRTIPTLYTTGLQLAFERAMRERCPKNVKIEFARHGLAGPVLVPADSPAMRLAAEAVAEGFGVAPALIREGGSIPVVALFKSVLNVDTLLVGFGLPDDRVHSPDEKFDLDAFHGGMRTAAALYEHLAKL